MTGEPTKCQPYVYVIGCGPLHVPGFAVRMLGFPPTVTVSNPMIWGCSTLTGASALARVGAGLALLLVA
jgi:hypothetical protein